MKYALHIIPRAWVFYPAMVYVVISYVSWVMSLSQPSFLIFFTVIGYFMLFGWTFFNGMDYLIGSDSKQYGCEINNWLSCPLIKFRTRSRN
jgi:hypothetical protein